MEIKYYLRKTTGAFTGQEIVYPVVYNSHRIEADDLFELLERNSNVSSSVAKMVVDALAREIRKLTLMGHPVYVPQLGTFTTHVKGKVSKNANGKPQLTNPKADIAFTPSSDYIKQCKKVKFTLESATPIECKSLDKDEAMEAASHLLEKQDFFMQEEFAKYCDISRGTASKVLAKLVADGALGVRLYGRSKIYYNLDEKSNTKLQGE